VLITLYYYIPLTTDNNASHTKKYHQAGKNALKGIRASIHATNELLGMRSNMVRDLMSEFSAAGKKPMTHDDLMSLLKTDCGLDCDNDTLENGFKNGFVAEKFLHLLNIAPHLFDDLKNHPKMKGLMARMSRVNSQNTAIPMCATNLLHAFNKTTAPWAPLKAPRSSE
jgi:hypothetical protein